jgi:hypothetical protein
MGHPGIFAVSYQQEQEQSQRQPQILRLATLARDDMAVEWTGLFPTLAAKAPQGWGTRDHRWTVRWWVNCGWETLKCEKQAVNGKGVSSSVHHVLAVIEHKRRADKLEGKAC